MPQYTAAVNIQPTYWRSLFHLGIAKEEVYGLDHTNYAPLAEAVSAYSRAWNAEPRHYESVLNRGIALAKLGHADEAIESWQRAMKVLPADFRAPFNLGLGMQKLEPPQHDEAILYFQAALKATDNPSRPGHGTVGSVAQEKARAYAGMGVSFEALERFSEASDAYMLAKNNDPIKYPDGESKAMTMTWKAEVQRREL